MGRRRTRDGVGGGIDNINFTSTDIVAQVINDICPPRDPLQESKGTKWHLKVQKVAHRRREQRREQNRADTAILDSRATSFYFNKDAPVTNVDPHGNPMAQRRLPNLPQDFPRTGHVMEGFQETLLGLGPICDADCQVTFDRWTVTIRDRHGRPILWGWRETCKPKLWRINLRPGNATRLSHDDGAERASLAAHSAYDLPSVCALDRYYHVAAGFPVRTTWLATIKAAADETLKGHMVQGRQGVRSTKKRRAAARTRGPAPAHHRHPPRLAKIRTPSHQIQQISRPCRAHNPPLHG